MSREIKDIQNQIVQEQSKGFKSKIEKLANDLKMLQKENAEIVKQLREN